MDLVRSKEIFEVLKGVDVSKVAIFKNGEGGNALRAITEDFSTIVYCDVEEFIDCNVGVLSVKGILSRLNLFSEEKSGVELVENDSKKASGKYVSKIKIKEGRRRSTVTTTDPAAMGNVPDRYPDSERVAIGEFPKQYIDFLSKMKNSIGNSLNSETMYVEVDFNEESDKDMINISIGGGSDDYEDVLPVLIEDPYVGLMFSAQWKIDPFIRVMKKAASLIEDDDDGVCFSINDIGMMEVEVGELKVSLAPMNVTKTD